MLKRKPILLVVILAFALVAAACSPTTTTDGGDEGLDIHIGAVLPLTGALSDFGPAMERAVRLAIEVFEKAANDAGFDINVTLSVEDSQTDKAAAVEAATKLFDSDGVDLIIGAGSSSATIAIAESVSIPNGLLQITPSGTSGDITTLDDNGLIFRTPPSDENQAPLLAQALFDAFGEGPVSFGARNDEYGKFIIEGTLEEYEKLGGTKTREPVLWDPDAATFDSEAGQIVGGSPDGFALVDFPGTWQKMGAALVRAGWDPAKTFSADGLKTSKLPADPPTGSGKEATEGMKGTAPGGSSAFNTLWEKRVQDVVRETFDAHAFDATILALLSAVAAGSNDGADMAAEMEGVSGPEGAKYTFEELVDAIKALVAGEDIDYEGASGPINLDENGDPQSEGAIYELYEFKDGELTVTESVEVAASEG